MYPLMTLYRMRRNYRPGIHLGYKGMNEAYKAYLELQAAGQRLAEHSPELFQIVFEGRHGNEISLTCDEQIALPGLPELAAELHADALAHDAGRSLAQMELLATVMAKGDVYSYYGNSFDFTRGALHLFVCGIDWSLYKDVTAQRWSNFAGTFTEHQDESDVMEAQVTCRCEEAADEHELRWGDGGIKFGMSLPSIATVIVKLDSGVLFEIMDER
jgi:hypothetical protein